VLAAVNRSGVTRDVDEIGSVVEGRLVHAHVPV
jgi:hypothetical protein